MERKMYYVMSVVLVFVLGLMGSTKATLVTDDFEYADDAALQAAWFSWGTLPTLSTTQNHTSGGTQSVDATGYVRCGRIVSTSNITDAVVSTWLFRSGMGNDVRVSYKNAADNKKIEITEWHGTVYVQTYEGTTKIIDVTGPAEALIDGWNKLWIDIDSAGSADIYWNDSYLATMSNFEGFGAAYLTATGPNVAFFDDFSVIPEPATILILTVGGWMTVLNRRRKLHER